MRPSIKEDMATLWTLQTMDDAKAKHQFIMVTPIGTPRVTIIDAQRLWMSNPAIVFQTGYRIAGTPEDITAALIPVGITSEAILNLLGSTITINNYQTEMSLIYQEEVQLYNSWKRAVLKSNVDSPGAKLFDIIVSVNPEVLQRAKITKEAKTLDLTTGKGGKGRTVKIKSIVEKINGLTNGRVLDVSELKHDGTGTKQIPPPTRVKKFGSPNLPIVSADLEHYIMAINMLPGGQEQYAADIDYVRQLFERGALVQTKGAILNVPGTVPIPQTQPIVPVTLPAPKTPTTVEPPKIPLPTILQGTTIPQTEMITPTQAYPMLTKRKRKQLKDTETAVKGLQPRTGILQVPGQTPIPTPFPQNQTVPIVSTPFTQTQIIPTPFPQQIPTILPGEATTFDEFVDINEETGEPEELEESEESEEEPLTDEEFDEFNDEELDIGPVTLPTLQNQPVVPTLQTRPIVPTLQTQPIVPTTIVPTVPTLQTQPIVPTTIVPTVPTLQTQLVIPTTVVPKIPTLQIQPVIPTTVPPNIPALQTRQAIPQTPVGPRIPTIPVIPQTAGPRTPTIPVIPQTAGPRTPTIPIIPQTAGPRTPTIPIIPQTAGPRTPTIPIIPQTAGPRTPTIPIISQTPTITDIPQMVQETKTTIIPQVTIPLNPQAKPVIPVIPQTPTQGARNLGTIPVTPQTTPQVVRSPGIIPVIPQTTPQVVRSPGIIPVIPQTTPQVVRSPGIIPVIPID